MDADWQIRRLDDDHEWDGFSCGDPSLDSFLKQHAEENDKRGVSRLWVVTRPGSVAIAGYYASAVGVFQRESLAKERRAGLPRYPLPTVHMGRLAVDRGSQRQGLGEVLLFHFLQMALDVSTKVGVFAVDVRAKDDEAKAYYLRYGFIPLLDDPLHLFLPMEAVNELLAN